MNKVLGIPLIVFSLIITFANNAEAAARCKGVTLTYSFPTKFEYTYNDIDSSLQQINIELNPTVSGECKKSNKELDQQLYLIGYNTRPRSNCNGNKDPFTITDPTKVLQYKANTCSGIIALSWENSIGGSSVTPSYWSRNSEITDFLGISLTKRPEPGETIVNTNFLKPAYFGSMLNGDPKTVERENITFNMPDQIKLIYKATCKASVDDVDFGRQFVDSISLLEKTINIKIQCHEILPSYKITVGSKYGIETTNPGHIKSNNDNIGFELTWDDNQVKTKGEHVSFGEKISAKKPTSQNLTIPIKVKPVLYGNSGNAKLGKINAVVNIDLTYN